jgi:hypothetical protein
VDHRRGGKLRVALGLACAAALAGCGGTTAGKVTAIKSGKRARWVEFIHVQRPFDLAGAGGSLVLASGRNLSLLTAGGRVQSFAPAYASPGGSEPYIAQSPGGCFGRQTVYALRLKSGRGVVAISPGGAVRRVATISAPGLPDGITFDGTGAFAHRLLVTVNAGARTTVDAIDCHGVVTAITRTAPRVEGGIAVAPRSFGRFAGDLIAPDEHSGKIFAITPQGNALLVANSGLPRGGDVGVESEGFVPAGERDALVSDRRTPGNPHPGDDVLLHIEGAALRAAGARTGDLLVAAEGGAFTDLISCTHSGCSVRFIADGPTAAHLEGHIVFAPPPTLTP